jgi:hypothetical protein
MPLDTASIVHTDIRGRVPQELYDAVGAPILHRSTDQARLQPARERSAAFVQLRRPASLSAC